jgi:hypothetical protein
VTFSYSGNPANSDVDQLRFLMGDTNKDAPYFTDEEIAYLVATNGDILTAAMRGVEGIMAQLSGAVDESVGSVSIQFSKKNEGYQKLWDRLNVRLAMEGAVPYAGGISRTDKKQVACDPDREPTQFTVRMHDTGRTTKPSSRSEVLGDDDLPR